MLLQSKEEGVVNAGRLASLAIKDWFAGHLTDGFREWRCHELRDQSRQFANAGPDHDLIAIQTQCYEIPSEANGQGHAVVSSMCRYCRYHFIFKLSSGQCGNNSDNPMHHFICNNTQQINDVVIDDPNQPDVKLYPLVGSAAFSCTVCPQIVEVEVSLPRMKSEWLRMVADERRVKNALRTAQESDPERFRDSTTEKDYAMIKGALMNLNKYLRNVLEDDGMASRKRISFRNKSFMVQFGEDCAPLFHYLGFEVDDDHTRDEKFWLPPRLPPQEGKTPYDTMRAFYEDARSEVQSFLDENPPQNAPVVKPVSSARDMLEDLLSCRPSKLARDRDSGSDDWRTLGLTAGAEDDLLKYAYTRQSQMDPHHQQIYLDALGRLASDRDFSLQMFVVEQREQREVQQKSEAAQRGGTTPSDKAYGHFGLPGGCTEGDQLIINVYRTYREQSPAQKHEHRKALLQIGQERNSNVILAEVYQSKMEPAEAYALLGAEMHWPMDTIASLAQSMLEELDLELVIMALETILLNRPPDDVNRASFQAILSEIRSRRSNPESQEPANMDLPAGLGNLRNTCYLNSILQYFYSVKAVRNLVLDLEGPPLEPTEENFHSLLHGTGTSDLETGRAFVGEQFARELLTLFRELDSSTDAFVTPRQRLANAALLRPEKMRPQSEQAATVAGPNNGEAPPLPPRGGENADTKVTIESIIEPSETASNVSSQTLVNQLDEDPSYVVVERDAAKAADASYPTAPLDVEMKDGEAAPQTTSREGNEASANQSKLTVEELAAELDKPNVGSDQMDVDEVMGNAIDHLRAAFKVDHIGSPDAVPDPIEEAFFSTFVDNRKKVGETAWNRSTRTDRWVTAYPAIDGTRDIYEALGNSFNLEKLPGNLLSFTTIDRPAPNFHICIQRSDGVRKNSNPIVIYDPIYLDRFLDSRHNDPDMFWAKKRSWDIGTRLNELTDNRPGLRERQPDPPTTNFVLLKPNKEEAKKDKPSAVDVEQFIYSEHVDIARQGKESWSVLKPEIKDIFARHDVAIELPTATAASVAPVHPSSSEEFTNIPDLSESDISEFWGNLNGEESHDKGRLTEERSMLFRNVKEEVEYRLHAVVCHAGSTASAGHYWVWIHDFEQDVWRKYNDTRVSVHSSDFVFQELSTKGEPYYLAYVRAKDIPQLVNTPRRQVPVPVEPIDPRLQDGNFGENFGEVDLRTGLGFQRLPSIKDTLMPDAYEKPVAEHVEDVEMTSGARVL